MGKYPAIIALLALAGSSVAQVKTGYINDGQTEIGYVTVAFGKVKAPNGKMVDISGIKLPYRMERIQTTKTSKIAYTEPVGEVGRNFKWPWEKGGPKVQGQGGDSLQAIYQNDHQANGNPNPYGEIGDFFSCSIVDDITPIAGTLNKPWKWMTFGLNASAGSSFLCRYTAFNNYTTGRGAGVMAFDPYPVPSTYRFDFGFIWNNWPGDARKITVDISAAQVWSPANTFYLAMQYRQKTTPVNPDAPFNPDARVIFSQVENPQVGSSNVYFWLDQEPDGIYAEDDIDSFGSESEPSGGNVLLKLEADTGSGGSVETVRAGDVTVGTGFYVSGNFLSTWFQDSSYYVVDPDLTLNRSLPPASIILTSLSPSLSISSLSASGFIKFTSLGTFTVDLYRYSGTPGWVQVASGSAANADVPFFGAYTAGQLNSFINQSTGEIKMRVTGRPDDTAARNWRMSVNAANWTIGYP